MTEPKKQDGTMELDVNQIDLLDLPLPPTSKPALERSDEPRAGSKGPPPLPPSLPPMTGAPEAPEDPPVPSLVLPEPSAARATPVTSPPVSARKLVGPAPDDQKSPIGRFLIGMGAASIVCVLAVVAWKSTHKTQAVPTPPAATSAAPAPTHAFTMAPIEFTAPVSSSSAQEETPPTPSASAQASATAHPSTTSAATTTNTAHTGGTGTARPTAPAGSTKPPRTDELIKVEN